jgi:hypothetical protein
VEDIDLIVKGGHRQAVRLGDQKEFARMVEKAREEEEICSREDTPHRRRVLTAFLYHVGLSCRKIEPFVDRSYEAVRQRFHRLRYLFETDTELTKRSPSTRRRARSTAMNATSGGNRLVVSQSPLEFSSNWLP